MHHELRPFSAAKAERDILGPSIVVATLILIFAWLGWNQRVNEVRQVAALSELAETVGYHRTLSVRGQALLIRSRLEPHPDLALERAAIAADLAEKNALALALIRDAGLAEGEFRHRLLLLRQEIEEVLVWAARHSEFGGAVLARHEDTAAGIVEGASRLSSDLAATVAQELKHGSHKFQNLMAFGTGFALIAYLGLAVLPARARYMREAQRLSTLREEVWTLSTIARKTRSAVILTDPLGRVTWVNAAFTDITGFQLEEMLEKTPGSVLQCPETDQNTVAAMRVALAKRKPIRCELLNRAKDGRRYWLDLDIQPHYDQAGAFAGFLAVQSDVTQHKQLLAAVEDRNRDLETMSEIARLGVWTWTIGQRRPEVSAQAQAVLEGLCLRTLRRSLLDCASPTRRREIMRALLACARGEAPAFAVDLPVRDRDGAQRWLRITARLDLAKRELIGSVQDVGDLVAAHREAVEARTRLELAAHSARLGPFEWHLGSDILWAGEVWWTNLGFANAPKLRRLDDLVGLAHPEDRRDLALAIAGFTGASDATLNATFRLAIGDGGNRWVEIVARETTGAEADGVRRISGVLRDVNDERVAAEQALYAASHDLLTGLPNRAELKERATSALAREARGGGSVAIMLLDLDRFKGVNDTFGHATGDAVLVEVAARLRECVHGRSLVARIGGDEFAILVGDDPDPGTYCAETAARIIDAVGRPISVGERRIVVGTSIGIAIGSDHGRTFDALLRNADAALYKAKAAGKGRFCFFDDALAASEADRRVLQADLREAVERGEMRLHYQPEIDLATGRIRAVEALVRWMHPRRGLIPPDQFIPIAEETGLIVPIGNWVIETACRQAALWPEDVIVAVNLSAAQVGKVDLVHVVGDAIARAGIAPSRLEIEVTESVFLTADPVLLSDLEQLDAMGVRLALDDFGTGYSSLAYLQRLPFKRIKIDRSFVAGIAEDPRAMAIIRAIVDLAAALGADTTAEGVETEAQRILLARNGCTHAQGFLFSRPVPEIDFGSKETALPFRKEMGRVA